MNHEIRLFYHFQFNDRSYCEISQGEINYWLRLKENLVGNKNNYILRGLKPKPLDVYNCEED